jgi:hypothetical protein
MSAHNKMPCLIDSFVVTTEAGDTATEVLFTIEDDCGKLTSAALIKQVLNAAISAYIALEDFTFGNQCHEGGTCCCGYPITWTLATKSAVIDFGAAHTYDDVASVTVTAPFSSCG